MTLPTARLFASQRHDSLFYTLLGFFTLEVTLIISSAILISAMVADVVKASELTTDRRSEGVCFAVRFGAKNGPWNWDLGRNLDFDRHR